MTLAIAEVLRIVASVAPIIGGAGTVFGPLIGALVVKSLGEAAKLLAGDAPGLDLVIYGVILVLVVAFAPNGITGLISRLERLAMRRLAAATGA